MSESSYITLVITTKNLSAKLIELKCLVYSENGYFFPFSRKIITHSRVSIVRFL